MVLTVVILLGLPKRMDMCITHRPACRCAFMAGSARRRRAPANVARPIKALRLCEGAAIALLILTPWFFRYEVLYFVLAALGGGLGGAVFIAATKALTADDPASRGRPSLCH